MLIQTTHADGAWVGRMKTSVPTPPDPPAGFTLPELTLFVLESFAEITAKETEFLQRDLRYHPSICEDGGHTWACAEG